MEQIIIAERLATLRKNAAISQSHVAEVLSVSRQAVSKWESGKASPSINVYSALAALYGVTPDMILSGSDFVGETKAEEVSGDTFAERLRSARTVRGVSQGGLAEALSVSRQSVSKWERGEAEPDADRLIAIASLLSTSLAILFPAATTETPADAPATTDAPTEAPVVEEPVAEEPVVEEPAVEEPAVEEPVVEEPVVEEPVVEEPVVQEPVAEEPAVEEPAVEEPAVEEPVAEESEEEESEEEESEEEESEEDDEDEDSEDSLEETIKDAVEDAIEDSFEEIIEDAVEDAIEEALEDAVEEAIEDAVENTLKGAIKEAVEDAVDDAVREAVKEALENLAEENEEAPETPATEETEETQNVEEDIPSLLKKKAAETVDRYRKMLLRAARRRKQRAERDKAKSEKTEGVPSFRTVSDVDDNDAAFVFVDEDNSKLRSVLPLVAAASIGVAAIAIFSKKKRKK